MKIRMKTTVSGHRDGEPWPRRGETITVSDEEGKALCEQGLAAPVRSDKSSVETRTSKPKASR